MHFIGTQLLSTTAGRIISVFKGYTNIPTLLYSVGIFTFFKEMKYEHIPNWININVYKLSNYTFGLYLTHYFVLDVLKGVYNKVLHISNTSIIFRLTLPVLVIWGCCLIINLLRRIKIGRVILPY